MTLRGQQRPQQAGHVVGRDPADTTERAIAVDWLIDTGASIAAVRDCVGRQFGYQPVEGLYATSTTGASAGLVVDGLQAEFSVEDQTGAIQAVRSSRYLAIKPNDAGSDVLGMWQLSDVHATVIWNPRTGVGSLRVGSVAGMIMAVRKWLRSVGG